MRRIRKVEPQGNLSPAGQAQRTLTLARAELQRDLAAATEDHSKVARNRFDSVGKELRPYLYAEQHELCAFCESPLPRDRSKMRIAHWVPISLEPDRALDWTNLYASCPGHPPLESCDPAQANTAPPIEPPAARDWASLLKFHVDGWVEPKPGAPPEVEAALKLWNLDNRTLRAARKAAIGAEMRRLDESAPGRPVAKEKVSRRIAELMQAPNGYVSAVLQYLAKREAQAR